MQPLQFAAPDKTHVLVPIEREREATRLLAGCAQLVVMGSAQAAAAAAAAAAPAAALGRPSFCGSTAVVPSWAEELARFCPSKTELKQRSPPAASAVPGKHSDQLQYFLQHAEASRALCDQARCDKHGTAACAPHVCRDNPRFLQQAQQRQGFPNHGTDSDLDRLRAKLLDHYTCVASTGDDARYIAQKPCRALHDRHHLRRPCRVDARAHIDPGRSAQVSAAI